MPAPRVRARVVLARLRHFASLPELDRYPPCAESRDPRTGHRRHLAPRPSLADEVLKPTIALLCNDIGNRRHAVTFDHRGVFFSNDSWLKPTSMSATVIEATQALVTPLLPP